MKHILINALVTTIICTAFFVFYTQNQPESVPYNQPNTGISMAEKDRLWKAIETNKECISVIMDSMEVTRMTLEILVADLDQRKNAWR